MHNCLLKRLWGVSVQFCLNYQITLLYIEWDCDLGLGWGRVGVPPSWASGWSVHFVGSQGQGETAGGNNDHQWFPVKGLHLKTGWQRTGDFQHLLYLLVSGKEKKQPGLVSRSCQYRTPSAAPLPREMLPPPQVSWSSVLTLLYQCGLVRKTESHRRRGSSMQGVSNVGDKGGRKN